MYTVASHLMDPLCTTHRLLKQKIVCESKENISIALHGSLAVVATPIAMLYRSVGFSLFNKPFMHFQTHMGPLILDRTISIISWNICAPVGGYSITDGNVLPWRFRIDNLITVLKKKNASVICLYEVFDIQTAQILIDALKDCYHDFYYNIGPKILGLSSGLFVASKFKITNPKFSKFAKNILTGRAKYSNKGVFSFDIGNNRIYSTHMQHSEIPIAPTVEEINARNQEMHFILKEINANKRDVSIVTGDLNLDDTEYYLSDWKKYFDKSEHDGLTWGGDKFCAGFMKKKASPAMNLDYMLIYTGSNKVRFVTKIIETGYDADIFNFEALSDHLGLFTVINF